VGAELKAELEGATWEEQRDVTNLARLILREWLATRGTHRGTHATRTSGTSVTPDPRNHADVAQPSRS
jgi:hypothetical protein